MEKLIKDLRETGDRMRKCPSYNGALLHRAADALENQQSHILALQKRLELHETKSDCGCCGNCNHHAEPVTNRNGLEEG